MARSFFLIFAISSLLNCNAVLAENTKTHAKVSLNKPETAGNTNALVSEKKQEMGQALEVARIQAQLNRSKDFNQALDSLQSLLKREPRNVEAHMMCGKVLQHLGYEGLADEQYRLADQLDPSKPDSILMLFHNKLKSQGPGAAYEYLQYVQRRFPRDPSVLVMQGLMEKDKTKAEFYYRDAMESNPNTPGLATWLGVLRLEQGKYREAMEFADRDLKLKADSLEANLVKAKALVLLYRYKEAIPYLQTALKGAYDRRSVADLLSRSLISTGQFGEALEPTLTCLAYIPMKERSAVDQIKTRLFVILQHVNANELINTLAVVRRSVQISEQMAMLYFASGDVLDRLGKTKLAEEAFTEGIKLSPYHGRPFLRLGIIFERRGDYERAFQYYLRAFQLDQTDRQISSCLFRISTRAKVQKQDLSWMIKDWSRGGRKSTLDFKEIETRLVSGN